MRTITMLMLAIVACAPIAKAADVLRIVVAPTSIAASFQGEGVFEFAPPPIEPAGGEWYAAAAVVDGLPAISQYRIEFVSPPFVFEVYEACVEGVAVPGAPVGTKPAGTPLRFVECNGFLDLGVVLNGTRYNRTGAGGCVAIDFDIIEQEPGAAGTSEEGCTVIHCRAAGDHDRSGAVDVPDIFSFLSEWFIGSARADYDTSGGVAVPDIFAFLSGWFAGQ